MSPSEENAAVEPDWFTAAGAPHLETNAPPFPPPQAGEGWEGVFRN
jgi:hypothetical protein